MSQEASPILTPEEQAELAENLPALLEAIAKDSPVALGWLAHWRSKRSVAEEAEREAAEIQKEVAAAIEAAGPKQGHLAQWCGFPTDMTRCSPFFPMRNNELGERRYIEDFIITSANWGEIKFSGPQLSTYDEDIVMILIGLLQKQGIHREECIVIEPENKSSPIAFPVEFISKITNSENLKLRKTYAYIGPIFPFFKLMGINRPGKTNYNRIMSSLKRMTNSSFEISISAGKTKSGRKRDSRIIQITNMITFVRWNDSKKELTAVINPFFYETYMAGRITLMDVAKRMNLRGVISKALYRFVQSQRQNPVFAGHFLTLADALNMDREQPAKKTRENLKRAINELVRHGILMKKSGFMEQDIIKLNRAPEALPKKLENH